MISDWNDLQTLLAIGREGSLSAAAKSLGVSQSTVSRRLKTMEAALNGPLFVRRSNGALELLDRGQVLIRAAERMEEAFNESTTSLAGHSMPVRLATCEVVAKAVLVPALADWARISGRLADVAVHDDLFVLPDDAFDVLVTPLESAPENMVGRRIGTLDWGFFASPSYWRERPLDAAGGRLDGHDVIVASGSLAEVQAYRWFASLGGRPVFSASSPAAQQEAAAKGLGIGFLPADLAKSDERLEERAFPGIPRSDVWMVIRKADEAQPRVSEFMKWARRYFPKGEH